MILVTGASGTVGSEVVRALSARGAKVRAAYRSLEKAEQARKAGIEATLLDFDRRETVQSSLQGAQKVFLMAPPNPAQAAQERVVVEEAKNAGVGHMVKLSVWHAPSAGIVFARAHQEIEKLILDLGIPYTFLRPNGFMQNLLGSVSTIRTQGIFYSTTEDAACSMIDARDIASVAATVLTESGHEGKAWNLSGPEALSNYQIAEKLSASLGRRIRYVNLAEQDFREALLSAGVPEWNVEGLLDLMRYYKTGAAREVTPWVERVTGKKPRSFDQFARDHLSAFREP